MLEYDRIDISEGIDINNDICVSWSSTKTDRVTFFKPTKPKF